jgi:iron(III) transport system permease protein
MSKIVNRILKQSNVWTIGAILIALLVLIPVTILLSELLVPPSEVWFHIQEFLLLDYFYTTAIVIISTMFFSAIIGVSLAYIVVVYDFKFKKFFKWALYLPLAIPSYIAAYVYANMFSYTGVFQIAMREVFNINRAFINIMSIPGAIFIFTVTLYPYVYSIVKAFLEKQASSLFESSRLLAKSPSQTFFKVILPLLRVAIVAGVTLVGLEVLNDYGVVNYFGVKTFSVAIFNAWFGLNDLNSAIRLSTLVMLALLGLSILEKILRGKRSYSFAKSNNKPIATIKAKGLFQFALIGYLTLWFALGFLIPTIQLIAYALNAQNVIFNRGFVAMLSNTLIYGVVATILIISMSLVVANFHRSNKSMFGRALTRITTLGYSIPGAIIAIAVVVFFISIDNLLYPLYQLINPNTIKLILSSSVTMLVFAYVLRFMAIGYNTIESNYEKIGINYTNASYLLGKSKLRTFFNVDLPMLRFGLVSAAVLVFVDIIKELPLTLILRPFNFHTLATRVYQFAGDEMIYEAAIPALILIGVCSIAIYWLTHFGQSEEI